MKKRHYAGAILGGFALAAGFAFTQTTTPVEVCDEDPVQIKANAGLRARACPEGFVGQWFQKREKNSCAWTPPEPQWYACALEIEPQGSEQDKVPVEP